MHVSDRRRQPYALATFESEIGAESCCQNDGKPFQGAILKINHKMRRVKVQEDKDCWFCWNNPKIEKDLIVSSQHTDNFYLALAKGPVCDDHFLILPRQHIASSLELSGDLVRDYIQERQIITNYLSNTKSLDFVLFERNMPFKF